MNVAQYIIARLRDVGVEHVFTVPGDYAAPFIDVLDSSPGITRVANINELGSGYAADGYGRYKGVGCACVQYGVGTFSLLDCVAGSYVERVPVVVISASPSTSDRVLERTKKILFHHSTGDLQADRIVFQNVTVASLIIDDPAKAAEQIDSAFTAMLTHRRPIYIEVLKNVWTLPCGEPSGTLAPIVTVSDPASLHAALDAAWARIQAARQPVIWAGVQIARFGLRDTLQALVDRSGLPFTTTSLGKTVLDEAQPQFIGTYAGPASPPSTWDFVSASDCVVALGTIITDDYLNIMASSFGVMIEVTEEEVRIGHQYYHQVTMRDFIEGLLARYENAAPPPVRLPQRPGNPPAAQPTDGLTYNIFMYELADFLRRENLVNSTALVLGESTSLYVFGNLFGLPRDGFISNAAWGSLGHETGAALGVMLGSNKRAFVVAGDGGFRMICQELSSLVMAKKNAAIFVMSNNVYAIEQAFVNLDAFKPDGEFAPFDILPVWDYLALAKGFGATGVRADTVGSLRTVLADVVKVTDGPVLVEVIIPEKDLAPQLERLAATPPTLRRSNRRGG
ncbi:alpha-keto acid decarboxylase family protein [Acidisphaera sp. S103]|uniref:alpha-keto acid decarboxylase family protein n=1 Tax=Acidisphaera sp. S103 TaxID=1747223 RepID=UPI00131E9724|nr:thiamine pyrophosphate-binding protein [Acidisphaera sp. S103]